MIAVVALALFILMFLIVFVLRTMMQKRMTGDSGVRVGVLSSSFGSLEWFAGWLLILALLAGLTAPIAELLGLDLFSTNQCFRGAGVIVATGGIALTFLAQVNMGTEWRIGVDANERTRLVTTGAFAIARNPVFSAMLIAATGLTLMVPNAISIIGLVLLCVAIELQVRFVEEPHLRLLHGAAYATYEARVGRFLPLIGRD